MVSGKAAVIASGKPFSPSTTAIRMSYPAVAQFIHHRQPELCPLVVGDPEAQNLPFPLAGDTKGDVDGLVLDHPAVGIADLHPQGVEDHDRIHPVQCTVLLLADLVQHGIGDTADQIG